MAVLYITEYANIATLQGGNKTQVPMEPPLAEYALTYSTTTQSAVFNAQTSLVRIEADGVCGVTFGTNPTATTTSGRMSAGQAEYRGVPLNKSFRLAVVTIAV